MENVTHAVKLPLPVRGAALRTLPRMTAEVAALLREREDQAFERGRRQAENDLAGQIVSQRNEVIALQNGVLRSLHNAVPQVVRESEQALIELALATAERLVAGLPVNVEMVEAAVREVLAQVEESSAVQVLLHAEDLALLRKGGSAFVDEEKAGRLRLTASPEVSRGGCVARTHFGDIDGRRETRLAQVRKAVTE